MLKAKKLNPDLWKITGGIGTNSNTYLLIPNSTLIDLGNRTNTIDLLKTLELINHPASTIKQVIFTHLHLDHIGVPSKFKKAEFFASQRAVESFKLAPNNTVLDEISVQELKKVKLNVIKDKFDFLEVIETPGHTRGSICLYWPEKQIIFTGDTLFPSGRIGRTDLPTSNKQHMKTSLEKLSNYNYKLICAGHEL